MKEIFNSLPCPKNSSRWEQAKQIFIDLNEKNPTDAEVELEIQAENDLIWDSIAPDLESFFNDDQTYIVRGYVELEGRKEPIGAIVRSYKELQSIWAKNKNFIIYDDRRKFCIDTYGKEGVNKFLVRRLKKTGKKYLSQNFFVEQQDPTRFYNELWKDENSCELNYYNKVM